MSQAERDLLAKYIVHFGKERHRRFDSNWNERPSDPDGWKFLFVLFVLVVLFGGVTIPALPPIPSWRHFADVFLMSVELLLRLFSF